MKVIKAPNKLPLDNDNIQYPLIFLAGSIEMGSAENWQNKIEKELKDYSGTILNPRRDDWDSSWKQIIENDKFREQVMWELKMQERADTIVMYFDINTKSPITLLELGLFINSKKLIVCCPDGFWRKGNVDIVCSYFNIKQVNNIDKLIAEIKLKFF